MGSRCFAGSSAPVQPASQHADSQIPRCLDHSMRCTAWLDILTALEVGEFPLTHRARLLDPQEETLRINRCVLPPSQSPPPQSFHELSVRGVF